MLRHHVDFKKSFECHHRPMITNIIAEVVPLSSQLISEYRFKKNFLNSPNLDASTIFVASLPISYRLDDAMKVKNVEIQTRSVDAPIKQTRKRGDLDKSKRDLQGENMYFIMHFLSSTRCIFYSLYDVFFTQYIMYFAYLFHSF